LLGSFAAAPAAFTFAMMAPMTEVPKQREEDAHDILAAEAFAMPASDPILHHEPLAVPDDPAGVAEPHDVLAAEEFPMPAATSHDAGAAAGGSAKATRRLGVLVAAGIVALLVIRALRRR
jgi:hypothetical protein